MEKLSEEDRKKAVFNLGMLFVVCFTSFGASSSLVSFIYDSIGLYNLGQVNNFLIYLGFFLSNFLARPLLKMFKQLKTAMMVGFFFYGFLILAALLTYSCYFFEKNDGFCSIFFLKMVNWVAGFNLGFMGATLVWAAQYDFIDKIGNKESKKELFGIFYSTMQYNGVMSNLINIVFYTFQVNSMYCFFLFYLVFCLGNVAFQYILPDDRDAKREEGSAKELQHLNKLGENLSPHEEEPEKQGPEEKSLVESLGEFKRLLKEEKIKSILPYMIQSGLSQGYVIGAIYRLVVQVYEPYHMEDAEIKRRISMVLICFSISSYFFASFAKRIDTESRVPTIKLLSSVLSLLMVILFFFQSYITHIIMVLIPVLIFSTAEIGFNQLTSVYLSEHFPGQLESFMIFKQCQNFFCSVLLALYVLLELNTFNLVNSLFHVALSSWLLVVF